MGCGASHDKMEATKDTGSAPSRQDTVILPPESPKAEEASRKKLEQQQSAEKTAFQRSADAAQLMRENQGVGLVQSLMETMGPSPKEPSPSRDTAQGIYAKWPVDTTVEDLSGSGSWTAPG